MPDLPMHYETQFTWQGAGANGLLTADGRPGLETGSPHDGDRYSPEHLLLAAAEVCLANTVQVIGAHSRLDIAAYRSHAEGELEFVPKAGYRFKKILIRVELGVASGQESLAARVVEKSHKACLVARSLACPVDVEPTITTT